MFKRFLKYIFCFVLVFTFFLFSGCQSNLVDGKSFMVSKSGVKAESYIPEDAWMIFKLGTSDKDQLDKFDNLLKLFPSDPLTFLIEKAYLSFDASSVDFDEDVVKAFGNDFQFMIALYGEVKDTKNPSFIAVLMVDDTDKIESLVSKSIVDGNGFSTKSGDYTIYSDEEENMFFVKKGDIILLSNDVEGLENSLFGKMKNSIFENEYYQSLVDKTPSNFGFLFVDPYYLVLNIKESIESGDTESIYPLDSLGLAKKEFLVFLMEDDGIKIDSSAEIDVDSWNDLGFSSMLPVGDGSYLYNHIPGDNIVFYFESYNVKSFLELIFDMTKDDQNVTTMISLLKAYLKSYEVDFEKDLLAFMDKGFAFSINASDDFIPFFGIYFDAESEVLGAKKIVKMISKIIYSFLESSVEDWDSYIDFISLNCGKSSCFSININLSQLGLNSPGLTEAFEDYIYFQFGVNEENILFLTTYPGFWRGEHIVLAKNSRFNEALEFIPNMNFEISFFDFESTINFLDKWISLFENLSEEPSSVDGYNTLREYLNVFDYVVAGSKALDGNNLDKMTFVKFNK